MLAATGRVPLAPIRATSDPRLGPIRSAIEQVAVDLAQAIVRDGEGATKFIAIRVEGGRSVEECRKVALGIAHSPLVKTAFFASDPNLGRIVCAIGNTGPDDLDVSKVSFWLDDVLVVERGGRSPAYREEDGQRVMKQDEIAVRVDLGRAGARMPRTRPSGPATSRTTTSRSTPTTGRRMERFPRSLRSRSPRGTDRSSSPALRD